MYNYIIPGIPPPPIGGAAGVSSLISTNAHSVVRIIPATDAAFSSAILVTFFRVNNARFKQVNIFVRLCIIAKRIFTFYNF